MKRYLVFAFTTYYPTGGWNDFLGATHTPEEAEAIFNADKWSEHGQVVDTVTMLVETLEKDPFAE